MESPSHQKEENEQAEAMVPDTGDADEAGETGAGDVGPSVPQEGPGLGESIGFLAEELSNPSGAGCGEDRVQWAGLEEIVLLAPLRVFDIFP